MSSTAGNARRRVVAAVLGACAVGLTLTSVAGAGFGSSTSASHSVQTKRIFSGSRTTGTRTYVDASNGTATTVVDALSYADAVVTTTGNWTTSFMATRYLQFSMNGPLPAGVAVSGATFDFRMLPNNAGDTVCYYFEVRRQSDNSLLGTHFSAATPQCVTGSTFSTISTALPEVTTSDIANDLYVKVFGRDNTANRKMKIDQATVTLTEYGTTETLYQEVYVDASTGTASTTTWALDAADTSQYTSSGTWGNAFAAGRYLQFAFPAYLPSGATVTGATFTHAYRSAAASTTCHYVEVYAGATLIGTHGSSGAPYSCNSSTTTFVTDSIPLPEVDTDAEANTLFVRVYVRSSNSRRSDDDVDTLTVTYSLS
jgi:hypothetical protein